MEFREATAADVEGIRRIARASLTASYRELDDDLIEQAVGEWYGDDLADRLDDGSTLYIVAEEDGELRAFSQCYLVGDVHTVGEIGWLHVHPDHRGRGNGTQLLERTERELLERGAEQFRGRVLAANESGARFYVDRDYEESDGREVRIGDRTFTERTFAKWPDAGVERGLPLEPRRTPSERTVYVAYDESERASIAPMYVAYSDENRERRYGWFCGNCEGFSVAMNAMGNAECNECGNMRKHTRWDASYL